MPVTQIGSPNMAAEFKPTQSHPDAALRKAAVDLEASFLAEMLKSAGLGKAREGYGGGAGEEQFSGMLARAQAEEIAKVGGIGLADAIFNALKERQE